jgi:phosphoserine aminotransferase
MARCKLGEKKHKRCEEITGKKYDICLVRGGQEHFWAICCINTEKGQCRDYVNYKTGEWEPGS